MLSQSELKSLLHYDPETGLFTHLYRPVTHYLHKSWNTRWAGKQAGFVNKLGYIPIFLNHKLYLAHRLAWLYVYGYFPAVHIDHIDRNPSNNKISNLRLATRSENMQNISLCQNNNTTGFLGVSTRKDINKYRASIRVNKKYIHLGYFYTPEAAHEAYLIAKRKHHPFGNL